MSALRALRRGDDGRVIAISEPVLGDLEERLVLEVLRSGRLAQGPMVKRFEEAVRQVVGTRHAVSVNNGTSALIAALLAHGIGPGKEVATSPFTFVATLNAILLVGAIPRFVDIGEDFNMDPALLPEAIGPATGAVLPVHLYGYPADMERVRSAAPNVLIIEDAAQALGGSHRGRPVGSFGTGCFSFYATKNVTAGEGGAITTDDDAVAEYVRIIRDQGQRARYEYERPGYNFRMTELQAAVGLAQMSRLSDIVAARRANAEAFHKGLSGVEGVILPVEEPGRRHVFHQYTIRLTQDARVTREQFVLHMQARGIECGIYYPRPVFDYGCFRDEPRVGTPAAPVATRISREVVSLPVHPNLDEADLSRIVETALEVLA
jgi:perosamine synthetase